jgi:hypothetical protein
VPISKDEARLRIEVALGRDAGRVPVRNVALPVTRRSYRVFCIGEGSVGESPSGASPSCAERRRSGG